LLAAFSLTKKAQKKIQIVSFRSTIWKKRERRQEVSRSAERDKGTRPWRRRLWKGGRNFSTYRFI